MGLLSNTTNLCQFKVTGEIQPSQVAKLLQKRAFKSIDETQEEVSVGWVNLFDNSDSAFEKQEDLHIGEFLTFSLRHDQRRIPGAVLREKTAAVEGEFLTANPNYRRVPKAKRLDIKEAVKQQLLARTLPAPTVYDLSWNLDNNVITFYNISTKGMDLFDDLFRKTFPELSLRFITPYDRAEALSPSLPGIQAANRASSDSVLALIAENTWIGTDFFHWLLYSSDEGTLGSINPETPISAYIDQKMVVTGACSDGAQKISFTGDQSTIKEVKAALAESKNIVEARIFIEAEENTYAFTLKGSRFDFASYKCPAVHIERGETVDELSERQAVFLERMFVTQKGLALFNDLFKAFLSDRISAKWNSILEDMRVWLV